ncbi:Acyl- N-acyltransferase [Fusarium albosuccineum]|uniref:Acyl- N-acyltransferase n=1 Tax=Fusarium albosuccineum TaxID=1237068 RepID=A0A8H4L6B3_9HYPO|nr:Acyl- N-acyltransferase [Fusarium albosuccineum]
MESTPSSVSIRQASTPPDLAAVVGCFQAYTEWLDEDISFQNYATELDGLPGKYAPPFGALLLAVDDTQGEILGCIAMRPLTVQSEYRQYHSADLRYCEIKRLFLYPSARGRQVGRKLVREVVKRAAEEGYDVALLDTLSKMKSAIDLYKSEGFVEVEPYTYNPLEGAMYFAKRISEAATNTQQNSA